MKKLIQRWLGITYINNSTVHKDIFWTEIGIINNKLKSIYDNINRIDDKEVRLDTRVNTLNDLINALDVALEHHTTRIMEIEEKERAYYESIDEDVSAEVQALNKNKEYMKSVLSEDNNDR